MESITLDNTLPKVFLHRTDLESEVWRKHVSLERGKIYLIEANSGTGKSSLCSFIIGYRKDYDGRILFDDRDSRQFKTKDWIKLRKHNLSILFQELRLFPELTAIENVQIKNNLTHFKPKKQIEQWFEALGIADKMQSPVRLMSFGQQQRVAMIRALVQPFDFLFADEPISHLDDKNSQAMADIMTEEAKHQGAGIVTTSIGKHMELPYDKILRL